MKKMVILTFLIQTIFSSNLFATNYKLYFEKEAEPFVHVKINNIPVKLKIVLSSPGVVIVNADIAKKANLKSNPLLPVSAIMDGQRVKGKTGKAKIDLGHDIKPYKIRFVWFKQEEFIRNYDGVIGPGAFKEIDELIIQWGKVEKETYETISFDGKRDLIGWHVPYKDGILNEKHKLFFSFQPYTNVPRYFLNIYKGADLISEKKHFVQREIILGRKFLMVSHQPIDGFDILGFKPLDISIYANDVEKSDWHNDLPEKGPKTASDEVFVYAKPKKYSGKIILGRVIPPKKSWVEN